MPELEITLRQRRSGTWKRLGPEDLRVEVAGRPQYFLQLAPVPAGHRRHPRRIVVALDTSGSMKSWVPLVRQTMSIVARGLDKADRVVLLTFGSEVQTREVDGARALEDAVAHLHFVEQHTRLYDAIVEAAAKVSVPGDEGAVPAVILVTDGRDDGSEKGEEQALEALTAAKASLLAVAIGLRTEEDLLRRLAAATGGAFQRVLTPADTAPLESHLAVLGQRERRFALRVRLDNALVEQWRTSSDPLEVRVGLAGGGAQVAAPLPAPLRGQGLSAPAEDGAPAAGSAPPATTPSGGPWAILLSFALGMITASVLLLGAHRHGWIVLPAPRQEEGEWGGERPLDEKRLDKTSADLTLDGGRTVAARAVPTGAIEKQAFRATPVVTQRGGPTRPTSPDESTQILEQKPVLALAEGGEVRWMYELPTDQDVLIGRAESAHIRLDDRAVSSHHARLSYANGHFAIRDLDSYNGTYVNEREVEEAVLRFGDVIRIGTAVFRLQLVRKS